MSKLIIANWKMNLSASEAVKYVKALKVGKAQVAIAAPFTFLTELKKVAGKKVKLSGQNVSQYEVGAYTGEISAKMLKEAGCAYCLVGHSERRVYFQENDADVNRKIKNLLANKIMPILCVGENAKQKASGQTKAVILQQLKTALAGIKTPGLIVAYEPVWAISTFQTAKKKQSAGIFDIIEAHNFIKTCLRKLYGKQADKIKIIYGGTVNPENSQGILSLAEVSGVLVGGASLKVSGFNDIIKSI